jgi:peptide/nickel transport system substrate-binding protein
MRKTFITIVLVFLVIWGYGISWSVEYKECSEFQKLVQAKRLPPVKDRLPEEPFVVQVPEIGDYGGVWRQAHNGVTDVADCARIIREQLVVYDTTLVTLRPNIIRAWQWNKETTQLTFFLRKGMKWSDGAPFTADDLVFWYEDIALNKEFSPVVSPILKIKGKLGKLEKLDTYMVRWSFAEPYGFFLENITGVFNIIYAPKHYLKQFHPRYTAKETLKKTMQKEGYDTWIALLSGKNSQFKNPELPGIEAWISKTRMETTVHRLERNPYYWKVDQAGNQLPYLDRVDRYFVPSQDAILLRAISGEIEVQTRRLTDINNYPILIEHQNQGNYRLQLYPSPEDNFGCIYFNYFIKDAILRKLFWDKRFRIALSIAINREEINQTLLKGLFYPSQCFPGKGMPWYVAEHNILYTEYNPKEANRILDGLGLAKRDREGYRLRPDGKRLFLVNDILESSGIATAVVVEIEEMVKEYWREIGVQVVTRPVATNLWVSRVGGAQFQLASYMSFHGSYGADPVLQPWVYPRATNSYWGPFWALWFLSNGKSGEEPPDAVKEIVRIGDAVRAERDWKKRVELNKRTFKIRAENFWEIGILNEPQFNIGRFILVHNSMRNVPKSGLNDGNFTFYHPASWFKKQ